MELFVKYHPRRYYKLALPLSALGLAIYGAGVACQVDLPGFISGLAESGAVYLRFLKLDFTSLPRMLEAAAVTVMLAALATPIGALLSLFFAIAGARNVSKPWFRLPARVALGLERSLPDVVVLFVLVAAFGIGVFPAVAALAVGSLGMLGKLWADNIEEVDEKPLESIRAHGGSLWQSIRFGILPQIMPAIVANTVFRFEVNVRAATVLGGLSGVGIGYELSRAFSLLEYGRMGMAIVVIIVIVHFCERLSGSVRRGIMLKGGLE